MNNNLEKLEDIQPHMIGVELYKAVKNNDNYRVKYILKHPFIQEDDKFQKYVSATFSIACANNKLEIAQSLLHSPDFKSNAEINYENGEALRNASENNNLEIIKYLTTHPQFDFNLSMPDGAAIYSSCLRGYVEIIDYFSSLPYIQEKFLSPENINFYLQSACDKDQSKIIKYFLESPNLKDKITQSNIEKEFVKACVHNKTNVIQYFIFDYQIELTPYIQYYLDSSNFESNIKSLFINRDLNQGLNAELSSNELTINKKPKI